MIATLTPQVNFPEAVDNFVHSPEPGVMNVHAKFDLDNHVKGRAHLYVPFMMVRRFQQGTKTLETVWSQEYTDQAFALAAWCSSNAGISPAAGDAGESLLRLGRATGTSMGSRPVRRALLGRGATGQRGRELFGLACGAVVRRASVPLGVRPISATRGQTDFQFKLEIGLTPNDGPRTTDPDDGPRTTDPERRRERPLAWWLLPTLSLSVRHPTIGLNTGPG